MYRTSTSTVAGPVDLSRNVARPVPSLLLSTSGGFFWPDLPKFIPSKEFIRKTCNVENNIRKYHKIPIFFCCKLPLFVEVLVF